MMKVKFLRSADAVETPAGGYGYATDEQKVSPFNFGLNAGVTKMTKFEWINNGGKDGAEQEALDIVFNINGTDKNYRMFPIVKAFGKNNEEITDPNAPEFKDAITDFNARVIHILHAFVSDEAAKTGLARPIANFKEFCQVCMSILPKNYAEIVLDIFLQFQWNLGDKERTYLEIPNKMKQGPWLKAAVPAVNGAWSKQTMPNPVDEERKALWYVDGAGNEHPFFKNGWFMNSNYSHQQSPAGAEASQVAAATTAVDGAEKAKTW